MLKSPCREATNARQSVKFILPFYSMLSSFLLYPYTNEIGVTQSCVK